MTSCLYKNYSKMVTVTTTTIDCKCRTTCEKVHV